MRCTSTDRLGTATPSSWRWPCPKGRYRAEWVNTRTGGVDKTEDLDHGGGTRVLVSPEYVDDIALRVYRRDTR